jgi:hypothetical protein
VEKMAASMEENAASPQGGLQRKRWVRGRGLSRFNLFLPLCKECGVPRAIAKNHIWEEHGRILNRDRSQRLIVVEKRIIDGIVNKLTDRLGQDVARNFIYAKAFDASHYVRSIVKGWKGIAAGYPLFKRPFYELLCDHARILGMADARLADYERGSRVVIACSHCYNKTFFAGDILGAVYAGEEREASIEITEKDGEIYYSVDILDSQECAAIDRYSFSWEVPLPGYISYKRCKKCGMPFAVSFFSWDIEEGVMIDTRNGEPVSLIDVRATQGNWVDDFLAQEVKGMVDDSLPGLELKRRRPEERIRDLFFLAFRGLGNPIFTEPIEDGIKARVENPFNYPIVAGISASVLARGRPVTFEWERSMPGRLEISLRFL